jgi:hypothetical protein
LLPAPTKDNREIRYLIPRNRNNIDVDFYERTAFQWGCGRQTGQEKEIFFMDIKRTSLASIIAALLCLGFGATANATTDNSTITVGVKSTGFGDWYGFDSGVMGSISPTTVTGGEGYAEWFDIDTSLSFVAISGFSSDPGQSWLTSAQCYSVTMTGASATYSYNSGAATWRWSGAFGFGHVPITNASCVLVHS